MNRCKTIFSCLPCVLSNFCQYTIYALSTNDEVKDDWVVNMVNNSARKNEANIHLSRWNRRKKPKRQKIKLYFAGRTREIPSIQDRPILPSRVANQNTGTGVSSIRFSLTMKIILIPNKSHSPQGYHLYSPQQACQLPTHLYQHLQAPRLLHHPISFNYKKLITSRFLIGQSV